MTTQTEKQKRAKIRNWCIFRIRSVHGSVPMMGFTREEYETIQRICDKALVRFGAEPESERRERITKELIDGVEKEK